VSDILMRVHSSIWLVLVIFFVLSLVYKKQKITPMVLRLFYLMAIATGVSGLVALDYPTSLIVKGVLAIVMMGLMEMTLGRSKKGKSITVPVIAVAVVLVVVVLLGFGVIHF